jgi:hypothetical protein
VRGNRLRQLAIAEPSLLKDDDPDKAADDEPERIRLALEEQRAARVSDLREELSRAPAASRTSSFGAACFRASRYASTSAARVECGGRELTGFH